MRVDYDVSQFSLFSPTVEKALKLLGHKQTTSSDSMIPQGPVSLLGRQSNNDLNMRINGSHVRTEETKTSSTVSLDSMELESVDNVPKHKKHASCVESEILEQQCHLQEEKKKEKEQRPMAEAKRLEEEEKCRLQAKRLKQEKENRSHEELEKKRYIFEDEIQRTEWREEEKTRKIEEEHKMLDLEECPREEEQRREEETSLSERLISLFGITQKKKEELHQDIKDEPPTQAPLSDNSLKISHNSTNPFVDIPLQDDQVGSISQQYPSCRVFVNHAPKVSAVKPR